VGLYVRVFCASAVVPALRAAFDKANQPDVMFTAEDDAALDNPAWNQINLTFTPSESWAVLECDVNNDLVRAEIEELSTEVGPAGRSKNKKLILEHLAATHFIISCQLPFDYPDTLWGAVERMMDHFVANHNGLLQVDNVGVFAGERLVWKPD
jgi:hypothetical protein